MIAWFRLLGGLHPGRAGRRRRTSARSRCSVWFSVGLAVLLPVLAHGESPTSEIKKSTDAILELLKKPVSPATAKGGSRREAIQKILDRVVDWGIVAQSSMGRHWRALDDSQKAEFTRWFTRLMHQTYIDNLDKYSVDQLRKVRYVRERVEGQYAQVQTVFVTRNDVEHPVEYRLRKEATTPPWKIYDVIIEGVSLVKNYRTQIDGVLSKSSFNDLIRQIKKKVQKHP